jgi:glycosyltransferase involved in cell wall biosynthesis
MTKKRILIFIDWFDPAFKAGGPIRSLVNFVSHMSEDFDLFVVTSNHDLGSNEPLDGILSDTWVNYGDKAQVMYASSGQLNSHKIISIVHTIKPDHIYLNSFFSKKFALLPLWLKKKGRINTNMILAPRGMLRESALAFKSFKKSVFLYLFRLAGIHRLVKFQATDEYEKNDILKQFKDAEVRLAPNLPGVASENPGALTKKKGMLKILFVGRIHPVKNLYYLLSALRELEGHVSCTVIGVNENPAYWNKCEKLISELPQNISVNYLGEQAHERILKEIGMHHMFALPTQGENFGHAIFEALSMGRPVLISDQTPWRNLEAQKAGWDLPLSGPNGFRKSLETAVNWDQNGFDEWVKGSLGLAKKFIDQSDMRLNYLKLFN